jgi:hypothetical protein
LCSAGFYNADLSVVDSLGAWTQGSGEGFQVSFDDDHTGHTRLQISELNPTGVVLHSQDWDSSAAPPDEWRQVNLWHDPESGLIKAELGRLSDGYLYVETAFTPTSLGETGPALVILGAGGPGGGYWNYLDNPTLIPEPASLSLFLLGALAVFRPRRCAHDR